MTFQPMNPEGLSAPRGFSHGMLGPPNGRLLFVAGQMAVGPRGEPPPEPFVEQFRGALGRVLAVVGDAGGTPEDIGRMTIFVTDMAAYRASLEPLGEAYRSLMGRHYPAMTLVEVKTLVDPHAMVEIEATAIIPDTSSDGEQIGPA